MFTLTLSILVNLASLHCTLPTSGVPVCTVTLDGRTIPLDPFAHREVCVGKACAGCNGADDVGSSKFYLECYVCWGDCCCGGTCTANEGWHCTDDGCLGC